MEKKWKKQEERQEIAAGLQQKTEKMCLQKGFCVSSNENQVPYIKYVHTKKKHNRHIRLQRENKWIEECRLACLNHIM